MIEGARVVPLIAHVDDRGYLIEILRASDTHFTQFGQVYIVGNMTRGTIRAWHKHRRGQVDYFICLNGTIKICAYDDETRELDEIISTGDDLKIVRVPGRYWHGFKVVGDKPAWLLYFVNRHYDYTNPDEERRPWDDQTIIPRSINGKRDDPKVGKRWDWDYPPHR